MAMCNDPLGGINFVLSLGKDRLSGVGRVPSRRLLASNYKFTSAQ
jgi:hypothetical protein